MKRPLPTHLYSQRVKVYRNLSDKCLSVLHSSRVAGHAVTIVLENVSFQVQEGGRQKVLRTKRKNVHAFVSGTLTKCTEKNLGFELIDGESIQVSYNPYRAGHFYNRASGEPIYQARLCVITPSGILAYL